MTEDETMVVAWLRKREAWWREQSHEQGAPIDDDCNCSLECGEAITYRIIAEAIEEGEHRP